MLPMEAPMGLFRNVVLDVRHIYFDLSYDMIPV